MFIGQINTCLDVKVTDSDIVHLNVAGTNLILLDSAEAAYELLEKRSSKYSGRYGHHLSNQPRLHN